MRPRHYDDPRRNLACGAFEVDKWTISRFVVEELVPIVGVHPYPLDELCLMVATVVHARPERIFEWGTSLGVSARVFAETARAFGIAARIESIDLPDSVPHPEHPGARRGRLVRGIETVRLHQGDGLETALRLYDEAPARALFFLDGDHARESVERELRTVIARTSDVDILIHDTFFQTDASGYNVGPFAALEAIYPGVASRFGRLEAGIGLPGLTLLYQWAPG